MARARALRGSTNPGGKVRKFIAGATMAAVATFGFAGFAPTAQADTNLVPEEHQLWKLVSDLRGSKGLNGVNVNDRLFESARNWTAQMARNGGISHNPNLRNEGPDGWRKLGENVASGYSIQQIHDALVASPAHYANLTDGSFTHMGLGVVYVGDKIYVTQTFATLDTAPAPQVAATNSEHNSQPKVTKAKASKKCKARCSRSTRRSTRSRSRR